MADSPVTFDNGIGLGDELDTMGQWLREGRKTVLATVIETWGSSPRSVGSHLVIDEQANFVGSVSGGCIESAVVTEAMELMDGGRPKLIEFGISDAEAWEVGLSCGGAIQVFLENASNPIYAEHLPKARKENAAIATVTQLDDGSKTSVNSLSDTVGELSLNANSLDQINNMLISGRSGKIEQAGKTLFVRSYVPPYRLIIIGAVHIAQVLATIATEVGYQVTVIDPRRAFANPERFPDINLVCDWPEQVLNQLKLDERTALVTLSHDPKIDDPALISALKSSTFHISALGSKRTHSKRIERLTEIGLGDSLHRIRAPAGLNLGGRSPAEIAVSILAQLIQERYIPSA
ncbi:MAG: XdhC family protein [Candidatus Thiodiazotropha sp. (ex Lucinoma borealis)]|nr:XdhC family protein [Candidatus Thiodiazotropha sp. (ex Lucinoma borealis)]